MARFRPFQMFDQLDVGQWWTLSEKGLTPGINVPLRHASPAKQEVMVYHPMRHALSTLPRIHSALKVAHRPPTKASQFFDNPTCHLRYSTALWHLPSLRAVQSF